MEKNKRGIPFYEKGEDMSIKFISGTKIYLRGLTKEDCQKQYLSMTNDVGNLSFVESIGYRPLTATDMEVYIESNNNNSNLLLGIFENDTDIHVGNIRLTHIKPHHNNCFFGIIMHRDYMGKGYASEATHLMIKHAFEVMNFHRIQFNVVDKNINAIKIYEKLGCVKEGVLREAFYYNNEYHDVIVYALLQHEYFDNLLKRKG